MLARMMAVGMVVMVVGLATAASAIDKEFYGGQEGLRCSKIVVTTAKGTYHGQFPCKGEGNNRFTQFTANMRGIEINDESPTEVKIFVHGRPVIFSVEADVFNRNDDSLYIAFVGIFTKPELTPVLASNAYDMDHFPKWMGLKRLYTRDNLRKEWAIEAESKGFKIANEWREFFRMK